MPNLSKMQNIKGMPNMGNTGNLLKKNNRMKMPNEGNVLSKGGGSEFFVGYIWNIALVVLGFFIVILFFTVMAVNTKCSIEGENQDLPEGTMTAMFFAFGFYIIFSFIISCVISRSFNQPINRISDGFI